MVKDFGYKQNLGDHTLFLKHSETKGVTTFLVYVDDIIVTGDNEEEKSELRRRLIKNLRLKNLEG